MIETAAAKLGPSRRNELLGEINSLRLDVAKWFDPDLFHSGFTTSGVIGLINQWCGTELPALGVIA